MKAAVRALFLAAPLVCVGQIGVDHYLRQPYPAFYQPSFGSITPAEGVAGTTEPVVVAVYPDGSTADFATADVVAGAEVDPTFVLQATFGQDTPRRTDPENVAWLQRRLTALGGGQAPASATIEWRRTVRDLVGDAPPVTRVSRSVDVDFTR